MAKCPLSQTAGARDFSTAADMRLGRNEAREAMSDLTFKGWWGEEDLADYPDPCE